MDKPSLISLLFRVIIFGYLVCGGCRQNPQQQSNQVVHLFNGKDLSNFYTFLADSGRDHDPKQVFTVTNNMIRISGEEWGCLTTHKEFENFRLIAEFKWGEKTFPPRENNTRDSGILIYSQGKDGAYGGMWMNSIEIQMIEGGTGDLLVLGDGSEHFLLTCPVGDDGHIFNEQGTPTTIHGGRIDWWGRDPDWKDVKGFRGKQDVEKPVGQWNQLDCVAQGQTISVFLNGVLVNHCLDVQPRKGKIQIQSEGAEVFFRRFDLVPLSNEELAK